MKTMREIIAIIETTSRQNPSRFLYHATKKDNIPLIERSGISAVSYWGNKDIAEYYLETIEEDGEEGVIISAPLSAFNETLLEPDFPGIDEPLTYTIRKSEETVWEEWEGSDKTWRDCLEIIGSIRYRGVMIWQNIRI